ncbi:MAG: M81 family metallopeptidase [Ilumatobacteraceae bacterium]
MATAPAPSPDAAPRPLRVAIAGFLHEANSLADITTRSAAVDHSAMPGSLASSAESSGAVARLRELCGASVEIVALPVWDFGAAGPIAAADFEFVLGHVVDALRTAGPVDAVIVPGHGAGRTTADLDPDAAFLTAIREVVGDDVPVVVVLDFHANVSSAMCAAADVIIGYRTNPHVDVVDRLREAAEHVVRLLHGEHRDSRHDGRHGGHCVGRTVIARCAVPMVLPQIAQLTTRGETLHEVMALAEAAIVPPVRNVSVFGGFSLADVPDCGLTIVVTADEGAEAVAASTAEQIAAAAWARRNRYRLTVVPLADAVSRAAAAAAGDTPPVILADTSDNPGGGAPGNATFILAALHAARVRGVVMGLQCDTAVVDAAWAAGVGARIEARFNEGSDRPLAPPFTAHATVLALADGEFVPSRGVYAGAVRRPGRCCALDIDGIRIAVSSRPVQAADDDTLRHAGLDPSTARVVVVKSRGHFRAGFDHLFSERQVVEVGAQGVATNDLSAVDWQHLRRPVFPLDRVERFAPVAGIDGGWAQRVGQGSAVARSAGVAR